MSTAAPAAGQGLTVREIAAGESLKPFVNFAWTVNGRDPQWVPPLRMALEPVLDRKKHPFHQHADVAYFAAERGGRMVGRVAAVVNHEYNRFHGERTGTIGFFECLDDADAAGALLEACTDWLRARGMDRVMGPFNFSTNDEFSSPGVLIDGFDTPPTVMMSHNPPYYGRLFEAAGWTKAKDLLAYWIPSPAVPDRLSQGMERLARRMGATIRSVRMKDLKAEVARIQEVYNAAWSRNWGFVPMTEAEFEHLAKELKPVVDPDLCLIAEKPDGEPIGFLLALPDLNRAIRHLPDGRLFPFGVFKFLWHQRRIRTVRVLTLGMKPGYQHSGLGAALYTHGLRVASGKGYEAGEASWILEDNPEMCLAMDKLGASPYKRYRVFGRPL
ncbi:GNAT family N-acetyltransferase [Longimicrobium terrae]|uniref:GNAT superfamily N-acetyltransferase n=1 Tax=Longimicrobium terrae TaxID=1639882 RepID=A0A841GZR1_9BACT|nr:GNAT superfamily N-acetyltransferase [Longimicrobium terrae]MBB6071237.1 GNAT superfamily N-acetyltransferase [Longimicrobium terrae]NNC29283.1 GNAT family N-acetyltransferase [Longimicrobium terrae]